MANLRGKREGTVEKPDDAHSHLWFYELVHERDKRWKAGNHAVKALIVIVHGCSPILHPGSWPSRLTSTR